MSDGLSPSILLTPAGLEVLRRTCQPSTTLDPSLLGVRSIRAHSKREDNCEEAPGAPIERFEAPYDFLTRCPAFFR